MNSYNMTQIPLFPEAEQQPLLWLPDVVRFLRRRLLSIIVTAVLVMALTVAYLVFSTPKFTATTQVLIDREHTDPFRQAPVVNSNPQGDSAAVDSEVEIIRSDGIARLVVRKLGLAKDSAFMAFRHSIIGDVVGAVSAFVVPSDPVGHDPGEDLAIDTLTRLTDVRRVGLSNVVEISVKTPSGEWSAKLANAIAEAYLDEQLNAKLETTGRAGAWLSNGIARVRSDALIADHAVQAFKEVNHIIDTDKGLLSEQRLVDINADITLAKNRLAEAQARSDGIDAVMRAGVDDASVNDSLLNPVIVRLRQQYFDVASREAGLATRYGGGHAQVIKLREDMKALREAAQNELQRIANSYHSDLAVAVAGLGALEVENDQLVALSIGTNQLRVTLRDLTGAADIYRNVYQNFLQRYTQAVQDQTFPIPQARIFTAASIPLYRSAPKVPLFLGGGLIAGLVAGCMVGFIRETFDRGLRTPAQVKAALGLDCIALLPMAAAAPGERRRRRRLTKEDFLAQETSQRLISTAPTHLNMVGYDPHSAFAEALRAVQARLTHLQLQSKRATVIGCISALSGEGKTTIAANLAEMLARSGSRTILLDWDLRKRALTKTLAPRCVRGFTELTTGAGGLDDLIYKSESGLDLLPMAEMTGEQHVSFVLGSRQTAMLIEALRSRYDHVVIDLPALAPVADVQMIRHLFDTTLVVVEWGKTDRDLIADLLLRGQFSSEQILGVVLNKVDSKTLARYAPAKLPSRSFRLLE